jgi:Icc-related predicted phosphoesterase
VTLDSSTQPGVKTAPPLRVAAAGDVHCRPPIADELTAAFERISADAAIALLAGDLTMHGAVDEAVALAEATRAFEGPVLAVLGNHDWHEGKQEEISAVLADAGVTVLERSTTVVEVGGVEVGIVGTKGFVGGFTGSHLPDFGEPLLRRVYAETSADVTALDEGLKEVAACPVRIVLLHYAPTSETLEGEPEGIWAFLGSDRLAAPIAEHAPDLVLHGHAHAGRMRGSIAEVPVFNVSIPVTGRDFVVFDLSATSGRPSPVH